MEADNAQDSARVPGMGDKQGHRDVPPAVPAAEGGGGHRGGGGRYQPWHRRPQRRPRPRCLPIAINPLVYTEQAELTASDAAAGDLFGGSVATEGDTSVIGAPSDNSTKGKDAGAA